MTTPNVFPLEHAGDAITLRVTACGPVPVGRYPEIQFAGVDAEGRAHVVQMPKASADRQLARANLTTATVVGCTMRFSRDENPSDARRPFWGAVVAETEIGPPRGTPVPTPSGSGTGATAAAREKASERYKQVTRFALETIVPMYAAHKLPLTATDVREIVAVLFAAAQT